MANSDSLLPDSLQYTVTPSGLTPNTRSEAEAALTHNSAAQTDSAAPSTPSVHAASAYSSVQPNGTTTDYASATDYTNEAQQAYHRPLGPIRTSSTNYAAALREAHGQSSASSDLALEAELPASISSARNVESPVSATIPFPLPGQGVVPLHPGTGTGQTELVRKARPGSLSLASLGRQQSWSEQDRRHVLQSVLMEEVQGDAGYGSGTEARGVGHA